ncbi:MAG TPA: acyl-[ACP]--phospholipid O-acyltransferase [Candidatus Angelobacter sp.]|nr:acyl-[ACP]--phospholipid O-acyltransferase [Candidatus Angelobacter sp.]
MSETNPQPQAQARWQRGYWSLIATQFQGAFNENGLKNLIIFLVLGMGLTDAQRDKMVLVVGALFSLPFILFSMAGGYFADRYSKRSIAIGTKLLEMAVIGFATVGLARHNLNIGMAAIFLASTQAALFGPTKYGLLPELLPQEKLSWGNGILEMTTFVALITAGVAAAAMAQVFSGRDQYSGFVLLGLSVVGLGAALAIPRLPAADPAKKFRPNFLGDLYSNCREFYPDRVLRLAVLGNTYFWFLGALLQFNIVFYAHDVLKVASVDNGILQAAAAIGIGVGSVAAGYLSGNKIEYGLIPLGSIGITVLAAALSFHGLSFAAVLGLLAAVGFASGFFAVPINALIQHRPPDNQRGAVIAAANLLSFIGVFLASAAYFMMTRWLHLSPGGIFRTVSIATIAATAYVIYLLPDSMLRLLLWLATHTLYRIDVTGRENVPVKGGALLVPNHVSMADAALLIASTDRPIRFLMFKDMYERPWLKPFLKILRVIPISSQQRPRELIQSLREATKSIREGELVCIFPEGQMTRIGQMLPFRRGMERIMKDVDAPIIPVNLDGVWGSIFSFERGRFLWKVPRRIPYPVSVVFGTPLPSTATSQEARTVVQELGSAAFTSRKRYMKPIQRTFIRTAKRYRWRFAMADGKTPKVSFGSALARTIYLARRLRTVWQGQDKVGILLPPSVGGALVNYAVLLMGKVPVNLNYTASNEVIASCVAQCGLKTVISSQAFLERIQTRPPMEPTLIEDVAANPRFAERMSALLLSFMPARWIEKSVGAERRTSLDDIATIIFSSGSTGDPKGVVLTHYNIAANAEQLNQVFLLSGQQKILGILPFFHSFGFTGTLALPALAGIGAVFHPNPLDSRVIGGLVRNYKITMLLATPTFLQAYMRRCSPEEFGSLQYVVAGAEKLPERLALAFEDHFGIRPMEGYGCTECSPVVAVNTPGFRAADFRQVGAKRGSIGHPLPGMSIRIVDPETQQPVKPGESGLLLVRGPNVMQGYLNRPEKTAEVLHDGWYNTGDMAMVDEDGFLRITDRLSRFSKIGGEMVPHIKVEDKLHELAELTEQRFAVTAVPDEKKGERLIVLHTLPEEHLNPVLERLARCDLPALWKPRADQFVRVEQLPYLGTGKLDLRKLKEMATENVSAAGAGAHN